MGVGDYGHGAFGGCNHPDCCSDKDTMLTTNAVTAIAVVIKYLIHFPDGNLLHVILRSKPKEVL